MHGLLHTLKRSMLCVTGVYLRYITNTFFEVILHMNVSHLWRLLIFFLFRVKELFKVWEWQGVVSGAAEID